MTERDYSETNPERALNNTRDCPSDCIKIKNPEELNGGLRWASDQYGTLSSSSLSVSKLMHKYSHSYMCLESINWKSINGHDIEKVWGKEVLWEGEKTPCPGHSGSHKPGQPSRLQLPVEDRRDGIIIPFQKHFAEKVTSYLPISIRITAFSQKFFTTQILELTLNVGTQKGYYPITIWCGETNKYVLQETGDNRVLMYNFPLYQIIQYRVFGEGRIV